MSLAHLHTGMIFFFLFSSEETFEALPYLPPAASGVTG